MKTRHWSLLFAGGALSCAAGSAQAGLMHAQVWLQGVPSISYAGHNSQAHANRSTGSKHITAHEQKGYNYITGNAGSGHAHHHGSDFWDQAPGDGGGGDDGTLEYPAPGLPGSYLHVEQTWMPNGAPGLMDVEVLGNSYFQVDAADFDGLTPLMSVASIDIGEGAFQGSLGLEMSFFQGNPVVHVVKTGLFESAPTTLVTHGPGLYSLQFSAPFVVTVPGDLELDIGLDGGVPAPATLPLAMTGLAFGLRRRRRGV